MEEPKLTFLPGDFELVQKEETMEAQGEPTLPHSGFGRETKNFLLHHKTAVFSAAVLFVVLMGAIFIPLISPFNFFDQNVAFANKPIFSMDPDGVGLHLVGTDQLGRDVFVRIWYGARVSLFVAATAAVIDAFVGVVYGSISGYMDGGVDNVMMRILEVISGIPYLVIVLLLMAVLPQGIGTLILAYSLVGWTGMARLIRGQVRSLCGKEYVIAARIMGAGMGRIVFCHLVPNMLGLILVNITLDIPGIIFTEAFLSMLGMGVPAPYPSLGVMANEGVAVFQTYPIRLLVPALFICVTMLSFNLLGDKLQDIWEPKSRRKVNGQCIEHSESECVL